MSSTLTVPQEIVLHALAQVADLPVDAVDHDADVFDLGLDSLDFWAVLAEAEEGVGAEVPVEVLDGLAQLEGNVTVGQVLEVLAAWEVPGSPRE